MPRGSRAELVSACELPESVSLPPSVGGPRMKGELVAARKPRLRILEGA